MGAEDFTHVVGTRRSPREALAAVWETAIMAGWEVLGDYDLSGFFAADGGGWEVRSIGICRPDLERPFVAAEALTALCLPCSVLVYADGGGS